MIASARSEDGIALVSAITMLVVLLGLGFALLAFTDSQQHAAAYESSGEQAYALAEGALNAQIFQLSVQWPTSRSPYPSSCNASNGAATAGCPTPAGLAAAYPGVGSSTCPASAPTDAWSSSSTTSNGWTTYVRGDGGGTSQYFNSATDAAQPSYDVGDHAVWVRAVGVANCRMVTVLTKVTAQFSPIPLPQGAITANGFATSNNGNKIIVDTLGTYAQPQPEVGTPSGQPGPISMRCGSPLTSSTCMSYRSGQVAPDTTGAAASPAQTLTSSQINALRNAAIVNGTYFGVVGGVPQCPTSFSQLTGAPVFIEGPCSMSFKTTGTANSASSPGVLVINNGSLTLDGGATYFGVIYATNAQNASGTPCGGNDVVRIQGRSEIQGAIIVDGPGTVCFGSSGGNNGTVTNFVYDNRGFSSVIGWNGAAATPNSFRVLPAGQ
jgi:Tfp pilus assembly protein PilX